jgi:PAS domain S-box-containing protein
LNILLAGIAGFAIIGSAGVAFYAGFTNAWNEQDISLIFLSSLTFIVGSVTIMAVNRRSGTLAAVLFLLLLTIAFSVSDSPEQLADGRSLFVYTIPIAISSLVLRPVASFIFAGLSSLIISGLALSVSMVPNLPAIFGFFMLAMVSWLSSRSLEQTLKELRTINAELDQRVEERTRELSAALARELAEAGKTEAILQGIADGVAVFDLNGRTIVANPALSRFLDRSQATLIGVEMDKLLPRYDVNAKERQAVIELLHHPNVNAPSLRFTIHQHTLSVNAAPVDTGMGERIGTVAVFRDVTREAEVEQMKNDFVAMVSHELRTPLNAILGYTEMLRESVYGPVSEQQAGVVKRIESNSQRLLRIVSDLLDQARIEAGQLIFHYGEFSPAALLEAVRGVMDKPAQDKNLHLKSEISPALPASLHGDPQRLQQVLINLVNNAVKFTQQGEVSVRLEPHDETSWACIVRDTGPGIPPEIQPYVFDPFRQADGIATREYGGIGLGLSIVKRLVNRMGGEVSLESEVGRGSTFTVILPYEPPEEKK